MPKKEHGARWRAQVEVQVQFFDVDPMHIVWHGNYVKYLEMARCALFDSIGYNYRQMQASGYAWPIIDLRLRYVGPAAFGQRLLVHAYLVEWESRLRIDYVIEDAASGQRLTRASTTQVAVDLASGEMCFASPAILLTQLGVQVP